MCLALQSGHRLEGAGRSVNQREVGRHVIKQLTSSVEACGLHPDADPSLSL